MLFQQKLYERTFRRREQFEKGSRYDIESGIDKMFTSILLKRFARMHEDKFYSDQSNLNEPHDNLSEFNTKHRKLRS